MSLEHVTAGETPAAPGARASVRDAVRAVPRPLAALLAAATVLSLAWALFTPALQGSDETGHVAYVQHLAETGDGPSVGLTEGGAQSQELEELIRWHNLAPLSGVDTARPGWSDVERAAWDRIEGDLRRDDGAGPNPVGQNPPLYYGYEAVAYRVTSGFSLPTRLLAMRLANLPLLWITIVAAWLAIGELFRRRPAPRFAQTVGTGAVALLPMVTFMSGVVNPDNMLAALSTATLALALAALRLGPRPAVLAGLGALAGLSVLTHGRGLALVPAVVLVGALVLWRGRGGPVSARARALGAVGGLALIAIGLLAATAYSNAHAGDTSFAGELTGSGESGLNDLGGFLEYVWQFYFSPMTNMTPAPGEGLFGYRQLFVEQFLTGAFASLEVKYPDAVYRLMQVLQGLGLVLLISAVARCWEIVRAHLAQVFVLAVFLMSLLALLHLAAWQDLNGPEAAPLLAGRYLLPVAAVLGATVAFLVQVLPSRVRAGLGAGILALAAALSVGGVALTVVRFHA
jgi:4-amino-4-deoxy-L-arabinose transferase-like glycosyltransferase